MADEINPVVRRMVRFLLLGPFDLDLRLSTVLAAAGSWLLTFATWPSLLGVALGVAALIYSVVCLLAIVTGRSSLFDEPEAH